MPLHCFGLMATYKFAFLNVLQRLIDILQEGLSAYFM